MKLKNTRIKDLRRGQTLHVIRDDKKIDELYVTYNSHKQLGFEVYSLKHSCMMWLPYEETDFDTLFREVWSL